MKRTNYFLEDYIMQCFNVMFSFILLAGFISSNLLLAAKKEAGAEYTLSTPSSSSNFPLPEFTPSLSRSSGSSAPSSRPLQEPLTIFGFLRKREITNISKRVLRPYLDKRDENGNTCLHDAVIKGSCSLVNLLIRLGVGINAKNNDGKTPIDLASETKNSEIETLLEANFALFYYAQNNNRKGMEKALNAGAYVNVHCYVDLLSNFNEGNRAEDKGQVLITPLRVAVQSGCAEAVRFLLDRRAPINQRGHDGFTPLHCAAIIGNKNMVELLLGAGADDTIEDCFGKTAIEYAKRLKLIEATTEIITLLSSIST